MACWRSVGRWPVGNSPGAGVYSLSSRRASVALCTSVGPSARPMWNDSMTMAENGISFDTPSEPWICSARAATSWNTLGMAAFTAEMSVRTRL